MSIAAPTTRVHGSARGSTPSGATSLPDGRWLAYFTLRGSARPDWPAGDTYIAISRLPWVKALAAWSTCGTWTRGVHFVDDRRVWELGEPDVGETDLARLRPDPQPPPSDAAQW